MGILLTGLFSAESVERTPLVSQTLTPSESLYQRGLQHLNDDGSPENPQQGFKLMKESYEKLFK